MRAACPHEGCPLGMETLPGITLVPICPVHGPAPEPEARP